MKTLRTLSNMWNVIFFVAKSVLHLLIYLMSPMVCSNKNSFEEFGNFEFVENTFSQFVLETFCFYA